MPQSLENLTLTALARTFWDNHKFGPNIDLTLEKHLPVVARFGQQVDLLPLPSLIKNELKLAILEIGKRKIAKERLKLQLGLPSERPLSRHEALREFLPAYFQDHPRIPPYVLKPPLHPYFEEEHHRMVVDFFYALVLPNPRDNPSAIRECWTSPEFVPMQSIFLDNFTSIWNAITHNQLLTREPYILRLLKELGAVHELYLSCHTDAPNNETIPWFVFDVLTESQRDKIFACGESSLMTICSAFRNFFATIFCHWPWQDRAFERYFARKENLSRSDFDVLRIVMKSKRMEEREALMKRVFPG